MTPEMTRFLCHVSAAVDAEPLHLDDAAEELDRLSDTQLAIVCKSEPGPRVAAYQPSLRYSCELRARLSEELDDLELNLPDENAEGWLEQLQSFRP